MEEEFRHVAFVIYKRFPIDRYSAKVREDLQNGNKWVDVWDKEKNDFKYSRLRQLKNLSERDVYSEVRGLNDNYACYVNDLYDFLVE